MPVGRPSRPGHFERLRNSEDDSPLVLISQLSHVNGTHARPLYLTSLL